MNRTGLTYTQWEIDTITRLRDEGKTYEQIGLRIGRTRDSIKSFMSRGNKEPGAVGRPPVDVSEYGGGPIAKLWRREPSRAQRLVDLVFSGEMTEAEAQRAAR